MHYQKINRQNYIIRLARGERIIESLKKFCQKEKINGGFFYGLGAVDEVEIAHYDVKIKKYSSKKFDVALEMTNITGNIGFFQKEIIIHAHASFADKNMQALAGHLVEAKISGTAEIFLIKTKKLEKFFDQETGLKLFSFKNILK